LCGAFLLVRRDRFEELQRFDPRFFLYYEDVDLCQAARTRGWRTRYVGSVRVRHDIAGSSQHLPPKAGLRRPPSVFRYYRKHLRRGFLTDISFLGLALLAALLELVFGGRPKREARPDLPKEATPANRLAR